MMTPASQIPIAASIIPLRQSNLISLTGVIISEDVQIRNTHSGNVIQIVNCDFQNLNITNSGYGSIAFSDTNLNSLTISQTSLIALSLKDCIVNKLIISNLSDYKKFTLSNCTIETVEIIDDVNNAEYIIIGSEIAQFILKGNSISTTRTRLNFDKCYISEIQIETIVSHLEILNKSLIGTISIKSENITHLNISNTTFFNGFNIFSKQGVGKNFTDCTFHCEVSYEVGSNLNHTFHVSGIKAFKKFIYNSQAFLEIKDSRITSFTTSRRLKHEDVTIMNSSFEMFMIDDSNSKLFLKSVFIKSDMVFQNTTLDDNAVFDRVYLNECNIHFSNSSIAKAEFHSIRWPNDYRIDETISGSYIERVSQLWDYREAYRQLKVVSLSFENKIDAKQFLKNEVRIYYKALSLTLWHKLKKEKKFQRKEFSDWLILGTNSLFSDFGESLARPLIFLLSFTLFFFYLLTIDPEISIGVQLDWPVNHDWEAFRKGLGLYVNLLSPVHSFEVANVYYNEVKTSILGTVDFLMRIFSAYFLYYFVKATRKFNFGI